MITPLTLMEPRAWAHGSCASYA